MGKLKTNIYFKLGMIIVLVLLLLMPTAMVKSLVRERSWTQKDAIKEVSDSWSRGQMITGPFISIPYTYYQTTYSEKEGKNIRTSHKSYLHILPEILEIGGKVDPERRYRGIYEVVVYESNLKFTGQFEAIDWKQFDVPLSDIHFDKAVLNVGITDLKGIEKQIPLKWNGQKFLFDSGLSNGHITNSGVNSAILIDPENNEAINFEFDLDLKGSQNLYFTPLGKTTDVSISSNWPTPSFTGEYLPDNRTVSDSGFVANWNVLNLNRNFPQTWKGNAHKVGESSFGVDLKLPVDRYQKAERVAKYAILFIVLTFLVFFFMEAMNNVFIHPIQYLLVGIALVIFYTLLISFSEHMLFNLAYGLATVLTIGLVSLYTMAILKSKKLGVLLGSILLLMYGFIFTIIQMEDYALLIGSIGMFLILTVVMYFSRKIDWYNLKLGARAEE